MTTWEFVRFPMPSRPTAKGRPVKAARNAAWGTLLALCLPWAGSLAVYRASEKSCPDFCSEVNV